jgi:hypothetical protein
MCVEAVDGDMIATVWCNEGVIGRDTFNTSLLNKWEFRDDGHKGGHGGGDRGGPRKGGGKPYGGDRDGGGKPYGGRGGDRGGDRGGRDDRDDRPPRKTGWDGKPRDKKFYRKDD